jgi:hypothetical protein
LTASELPKLHARVRFPSPAPPLARFSSSILPLVLQFFILRPTINTIKLLSMADVVVRFVPTRRGWNTAPIRYGAELIGADTDSEPPIAWLIALMVLRPTGR